MATKRCSAVTFPSHCLVVEYFTSYFWFLYRGGRGGVCAYVSPLCSVKCTIIRAGGSLSESKTTQGAMSFG